MNGLPLLQQKEHVFSFDLEIALKTKKKCCKKYKKKGKPCKKCPLNHA